MEELIQSLTRLLEREFPGSIPELEQIKPLQKVGGFLIWSGFDGVEQIDRQRQLSGALKRNLLPDQQRQVTTILTLTPEESALMNAE
jgi:hypothetical protein